jgi:carbohydrate-binding DOMON domain-containing protein
MKGLRNVTPTDDLLDLDYLQNQGGHKMNYGNVKNEAINMREEREREMEYFSPLPPQQPYTPYNPYAKYTSPPIEYYQQPPPPQINSKPIKMSGNSPYAQYSQYSQEPASSSGGTNCVDCLSHISGCPVCNKIYDKTTMYIIVIIVMAIIILYLLKRLLERKD